MHIYFIGQCELRVEALAKQAVTNGHNVTVAITNGYLENESLALTGVRTIFFSSFDPRIPGGYLYTVLSCVATLFIRPDTIVVQSLRAAIITRLLLPFLPNTRAIWTIDSLPGFVFSWIASGFDQICVTSRTIQYRLLTTYSIKTTYVPDGYTIPDLADIRPAKVGLVQEKYAVLLSQNAQETRRIARAFAAAKSRKILIVFGNGRASATVTYLDILLMSRMASSIVRQAGVIIATSPAYSSLLLQAMDAGRQIIATTDSLHEEILGVTARYYQDNDTKQLTVLIQDALKKPVLNKAAALRAKHHFTWNTVGQEYERVYKHSKAVFAPFDSIIRKESFQPAFAKALLTVRTGSAGKEIAT